MKVDLKEGRCCTTTLVHTTCIIGYCAGHCLENQCYVLESNRQFQRFGGFSLYYCMSRLMLLHDSRYDDDIKSFIQQVHELYIKSLLNSLYLPGSRITSSHFDTKVRTLSRKWM